MKLRRINHSGKDFCGFYKKVGIAPGQKVIGLWGYPDPKILNDILQQYPGYPIVDLDVNFEAPETKTLPENYCKIMSNIFDNALALKDNLEVIVASVGEEKCDQGRFAALLLNDMGFNIIQTRFNEGKTKADLPIISTSQLPLKEKVLLIMDSLTNPALKAQYRFKQTTATNGFWGVPPNDLRILELFPDTTHVYGWTRAVEMNRPADLDIEMYVDETLPTVFFAQTFCGKMQLAKYLANKYDGLFVDVDDVMSVSVRAKIEAFLRLRGS
jgi:hypothetical protein